MIASSLYALASKIDFELLILKDQQEAQSACEVLEYLSCGVKPFVLPEFRAVYGDDLRCFSEEFLLLCNTLREFYAYPHKKLLLAPFCSLVYALPNPKQLQTFELCKQMQIHFENLKNQLMDYGYENVDLVEMEGEVSFRGDIIDIFIPNHPYPYRISLFDSVIEDIKAFDLETQLCQKEEQEKIQVSPVGFYLQEDKAQTLLQAIQESTFDVLHPDVRSVGFWLLEDKVLLPQAFKSCITQSALREAKEFFDFNERSDLSQELLGKLEVLQEVEGYSDVLFDLKHLEQFLQAHSNKKIILLGAQQASFDCLAYRYDLGNVECRISPCVLNILTPTTLILSLNQWNKKRKKKKPKILLDELNLGEYVVHSEYGIGIFRGIVQTEIMGSVRDFIRIDYQGEDRLLLPVENLHLIDRYVSNSSGVPLLDRLGKGSFARLKEKVKGKILEIAGKIIALAAKRDLLEGSCMQTQIEELALFQAQSGFEFTQDQIQSIQEVFADLSSGKVMDRLLSGDVGFGKTEVAMNALFVVCRSGFQGAFIVPTTLLSTQHYMTLQKRFFPFGLKVVKLDSSVKNKTELLRSIASGEADIVVGTHSVLGAHFKNLGLIVLDEEHKFGVKQKESIKELSQNVHLLSMSATPIPRTLNMALSQIKGMSALHTPPKERERVRTFVKNYQDGLIKEIINRELRRGGQVFYIHNHIASIEAKKDELLEFLPHLRIAILHSQIQSTQAQEVMEDFAQKRYDVLLCTSIVESGIHLSNANTMIVEGADRFGIADLHQLRGRVGRGDKEGFCYFLIENKETLGEEAIKRLLALERNSYLGSGASLAYHDLEIRGGGNLLGEAQSGHIKGVGYGLYLKMLEDCIHSLSGHSQINAQSVDLKLNVSAYLNPDLIASDRLRLELYRRLSLCKSVEEVFEIQGEMQDRFGKLDRYTRQFLDLILVKILATQRQFKSISNYAQNISLIHQDGAKQTLQAPSKDDDDVLSVLLAFLRKGKADKV